MKKILTTVIIFISATMFSQNYWVSNSKIESTPAKKQLYSTGRVAVTTIKMDTLYVPNDDLGNLIADVWNVYPTTQKRPVIIHLSDEQLLRKFILIYDSKTEKRKAETTNTPSSY